MKRIFALSVLFFVFCGQRAVPDGTVQTVFEKPFEREIENGVFIGTRGPEGMVFYPRIVELRFPDTTLSRGDRIFHNREVLLLDQQGAILSRLPFPYRSAVWYADNGEYFAVLTQVRHKPYPYDPEELDSARIKESSFSVYDKSGKMLWKISPYELVRDSTPVYIVSPKDGSVLIFKTESEMLYDPSGKFLPGPAKLKALYDRFEFTSYSDNWKFIVGHADKRVADEYGIPFIVPTVMFLDSNFVIQWESPLIKYDGSTVGVSANGSFIYASCLIGDTAQKAKVTSVGYVYNRYKERFMEIENGADFRGFSQNEKYLVADFAPPHSKQLRRMLIDVESGKTLYRKAIAGDEFLVADNGAIASLGEIIQESGRFFRAVVYDVQGNAVCKHDIPVPEQEGESDLTCRLLNWDGEELVISVIDRSKGQISILALTR